MKQKERFIRVRGLPMCLAEMAVGRQMRAMTNAATKIFMALVSFNGAVLLFSLSKLANYSKKIGDEGVRVEVWEHRNI